MSDRKQRKKKLDKERSEWRKQHRTLNGRIILYPNKPPEHINARASKRFNWFWKKILLEIKPQEIPAVIASIQDQIKAESDPRKIRVFRTLIGMAEDAYQLKKLEDIKDYDSELMLGKKPVYDSEEGLIYRNGDIFTTDYCEDESGILLRDIEGIIVDVFCSDSRDEKFDNNIRNNVYRDWNYMEEI